MRLPGLALVLAATLLSRQATAAPPAPPRPPEERRGTSRDTEGRPGTSHDEADRAFARASAAARARRFDEARREFETADRLRPDHAETQVALGKLDWLDRRPEAALERWVRALEVDPRGEARGLLDRHAPGLVRRKPMVADVDELRRTLAYLRDFRRQEELRRALADFNTRKGTSILLDGTNTDALVADLALHGYLERPGGPPTGKGTYRSDGPEGMRSTVYGSRDVPRDPPWSLAVPEGFDAAPRAVLGLLQEGDPGALEFGLALLPGEVLDRSWDLVAEAAARTSDPWARDAVLARLRERVVEQGDTLPTPVQTLVHDWASERPDNPLEPLQRWLARGILHHAGDRRLGPLRLGELDGLFKAAGDGKVPLAAVDSALAAMGHDAGHYLVQVLTASDGRRLDAALEMVPRYPSRPVLLATVDRLADPAWSHFREAALEALRRVAGRDLGTDPDAWRAFAEGY